MEKSLGSDSGNFFWSVLTLQDFKKGGDGVFVFITGENPGWCWRN